MAQRYHNPFANINLIVPNEQHVFYTQYCQSGGGRVVVDQSPFPRMVDFWFAGLTLGARKQFKPVDLANQKTTIIIEGAIFDRDSWRIPALMLIAMSIEGTVEVVGDPHRMMAIANGLAAAGVPLLMDMLREGEQDPIWNLSDALDKILRVR